MWLSVIGKDPVRHDLCSFNTPVSSDNTTSMHISHTDLTLSWTSIGPGMLCMHVSETRTTKKRGDEKERRREVVGDVHEELVGRLLEVGHFGRLSACFGECV